MAGSGGSGRRKSGTNAAVASKNHAAASNTLSLDNYFTTSAKKDKSKKASSSSNSNSNPNNANNANSSTPTFNPDQAARRMMGQGTPQRNDQPESAAAGTTANGTSTNGGTTASPASASASASASTSTSTPPAVNPNRAAIERARQGKASHKHRGSSPSKNSRKRQKSSSSSSSASSSAAASASASSSLSGSPRGGGRSPTRSPTRRKTNSSRNSSSSSSKTPTPTKKGPTIDLSMDSDDCNAVGNAASASAKPAASKAAGGTAGKKRKNGLSGGDDGDDDGAFVVDDGDDNENRINGSEDSTLAKQQAKQQQRKRSKKGLGNVAGSSGSSGEVIDMAKSIDEDEDEDDEVVEMVAAPAGAATTAAAPTGKRKRGGVKSKVNNGTAAAAKKPAASAAAQSIPAAASSDSDVVVVPNSTTGTSASASATTNARSSISTTAPASPPAAASAPAPVASSPAVSSAASTTPLQIVATDETHGLALVRIDCVGPATSRESIDLTPEARDGTANFHPLRIKAVLGRTGTTSNNQPANKIDLGIGNGADGVSRRQVRVKHISVEGLVVSSNQHSRHRPQIRAVVFNTGGTGARIFVGVAHYGPAFRYNMYGAGNEFIMNVGDCLVFDAYNASTTGGRRNNGARPAHVFRLVRYDKRDTSQAGASPPSDPDPAPALVTDSTVASSSPPITTGAAKRGEHVPTSNSAAAAGRTTSAKPSVPSPSRRRKAPAERKDQNPSDPPLIPASAASTPSSDNVLDTADIDKTVPRLGMPNIVVASMTQRQERPPAAAKPAENIDDKTKSDDASRADVPSPESSNSESAATAKPTAKKPGSKRKENATKLPPQPSVGDRFRVNFEELKNFFGVVETQWFCGTVEEVSSGNNKYEVNVRYDDGGIGRHEYPAGDLGRLVDSKGLGAAPASSSSQGRSRRKTQADDSSQSMERVESAIYPEGSKEAVFDPNPSELFVGDLVDCFYQNGKIDGAWYRGRVARVQISSEAGKPTLFDVAYNDQEYEKDIPLEHGNVRLFQRGSNDLSWLYGADVLRRLGRSKNATKVGTVKSSPSDTNSSMPKVVVELNDGTFEEHIYTDIAQEMFATYLQFVPAGKVKVWPSIALAQDGGVKIELPETNENEEPAASDDEEDDDLGIAKSKSATRKTNTATFTSTQLDDMLNDHEASQDSQQSYPDSPVRGANDKPRAKEMHSSMANALWSALNSAEPSSSAILLRHSAAFHHTLPNAALSQKTFNLMMTGPQNEGISFRDPNRMELAYDYMRLCLASSHRLDVGPNITSFAPSCWEDVQNILAQPLKETEQMGTFLSIKESESTSTMRRLGEALHTAASGLSCIDELLKDELSDGKEAGTTSNPRRLYMVNPTVRTALDANVREALKVAVRHAAQCWVRHGHFVIGDGDDLLPAESADEDWCAMEAKRCLDSLGSIISHLAWLYCAEEGIELSDNDCSFIIRDALRNELESLQQDSADFGHIGKKKPSVASWKKYSKRAKMWFILSLDNSFASPLQQNLATMLSLSKDVKPLL